MTNSLVKHPPAIPQHIGFKMPADVAAAVHRLAYETGRSKQDLFLDAFRKTYMDAK